MSQHTRAISLAEAVKFTSTPTEALEIAETFHAYLNKDDAAQTEVAPPPPPKAKATPPKQPKPRLVPESPAEEETEEASAKAATADDASAVIAKLLANKLRDECVALLHKYKATSFSGLKAADYTAFVAEANSLLDTAKLTG